MARLKLLTFNIEWMFAIFGGDWTQWDETIPNSFPGKNLGPIRLAPIADVPALCQRIAGVIKDSDAKIICIQEGPPRKDQLEFFVKEFLNDDYLVHTSNSRTQTNQALVHNSIADKVTSLDPKSDEMKDAWGDIYFQQWSSIALSHRYKHDFYRFPLVLKFTPTANKELQIINIHTKSKISKLKTWSQWKDRHADAVHDALFVRQKLSAEVQRIRKYLEKELEAPNQDRAMVIVGDFNDGPLAEQMEEEFLIHNIMNEVSGSITNPGLNFQHAMTPEVLETATTTEFSDPFEEGKIVKIMLDHILVSPGIWKGTADFSVKKNSCIVEDALYEQYTDELGNPDQERGQRPSDHRPVSVVLRY
jgi:endonuclease/exonuclease/phosphatase family metal-dependent hydrolase